MVHYFLTDLSQVKSEGKSAILAVGLTSLFFVLLVASAGIEEGRREAVQLMPEKTVVGPALEALYTNDDGSDG